MQEFDYNNLEPWEIEIVEKYPLIYLEDCEEGKTNLRYGFECGEGWADLIKEFSDTSTQLVKSLREFYQPDAYIHSCIFKEKLGELCWQGDNNLIDPYRTLFNAYTRHIENKSRRICELTGKDGKLMQRGGGG